MTVGFNWSRFNFKSRNCKSTKRNSYFSGLEITSEQGTAAGISSQEAQLTGIEFTASVGSLIIPNDTVQPSGLEATFSQGSIIGLGSAWFNLQGQSDYS